MSEIFEIPLLNPIRFIGVTGTKFDSLPAVELINSYQDRKCYFQKWQSNDSTRLQILSDFPNITFKIYALDTGQEVLDIVPLDQGVTLVDHTFKVYEIPIDFTLLPEGDYYAELSYQNNDPQTISFLSEPFSVQEEWDITLLFEYRNSENNFSVVFETGITYHIRLEGVVTEFSPQSDDVIYNDQKYNATLLNSIPYRQFKLYIGDAPGVPAWVADKINRVVSCDQVKIDGDYFEKIEGAAWEVERADEYAFMGLTLDIMPVENFFLQRLKVGDDDMATIKVVQRANNYFDVSDSLAVSGIFTRYTKLDELVIENDGNAFDLLVGITPGGSEVGEFSVSDPNTTIDIDYYFRTNATLYLTWGPNELPFVSVVWKELDPEPVGGGEGGIISSIPAGMVVIYEVPAGRQVSDDFNLATGLGVAGAPWEGWAICDGRNGTENRGGRVSIGYQADDYPLLGETGGEEEHILTIDELPEHYHQQGSESLYNLYGGGTLQGLRTLSGGTINSFTEQNTSTVGEDAPHNNMQPYIVSLFVKKIS